MPTVGAIMFDIDALEVTALAATNSEWSYHVPQCAEFNPNGAAFMCGMPVRPVGQDLTGFAPEDAAHMAANRPAVTLELIAEIRRLRADAERLDWLDGSSISTTTGPR
jgi:hypothetical protein